MFCPKCGKRQASEEVRYCTKCGLLLGNAAALVRGDSSSVVSPNRALSPRAKGVLQGLAIAPTAFGLWLLLDIFYETVLGAGMIGGLYAMLTLIVLVALSRILYAIFLEEGSPPRSITKPAASESELAASKGVDSLMSGEITRPISVTENTTNKLRIER